MTGDALFDVEEEQQLEQPIGAAALGAFLTAYGGAPISRGMIARLGRAFKLAADTYPRELVIRAAEQLGAQRVANPNAVEPFVLRLQSVRGQGEQQRAGWSALAAQGFDAWERDEAQSV